MLCDTDNLGKMESSDPRRKPHQFQNLQHQQQQMSSSGLLRYRSAPSSYFANFAEESDGLLDAAGPSSPETEGIIARFILDGSSSPSREGFHEITKNSDPRVTGNADLGTEFMASLPMMYQGAARPPLPNQSSKATPSGSETPDGPYTAAQARMGSAANNSNLFRHSSSPAGLFHNLNSEDEFIRGMRNLGSISGSEGDASFPSPKMKSPINFSSIPDTGNDNLRATASENGSFLTGFPVGAWEEHVAFSENFANSKRAGEDDGKIFSGLNASETQGEVVNHAPPPGLSRNMSLPKTAAEVASMEKYLQFQDSVPCKIRAKRGCATHPRSIAERVRRTRISERMRKLQDLVPNMDKQTSTADMLDFAVDYIKGLQNQLKRLSANRARCTCSISCT